VSFDDYGHCRTCHQWVYSSDRGFHTCPAPRRVFVLGHHDPEDPQDGITIRADDDEAAATLAIDRWDDERSYVNGPVRVIVRDAEGSETILDVQGELSVSYHATAVHEGPENQHPGFRLNHAAREIVVAGARNSDLSDEHLSVAVRRVGRALTPNEIESFAEDLRWYVKRALESDAKTEDAR
jgi:hypothetical protein